jgi:L-fuculose-phosphate aldolase
MNNDNHSPVSADTRALLVEYGRRVAAAGLSAGTGGNISAREGDVVWMKPAGFAMDELTVDNLCGLRLDGACVAGNHAPTSEFRLHLAVYAVRPDVKAVFHTHPPWLTGVISADVGFRRLTTESVGYLGRIIHLPYVRPQSEELARQVGDAARDYDTLLLPNHGIVTMGGSAREAFHRSAVAEDTAKSILAASIIGKPQYLGEQQIHEMGSN